MGALDRNAKGGVRQRRDNQRVASGAASIIQLAANGGLQQTVASLLSLKLADTSLALSASGVALNLATSSGLQIASGLTHKLADTSLALSSSGIAVNVNASGAITTASGIGINLGASGGLSITTNTLGVKLADATLALGTLGLKVGTIAESQVTGLTTDLAAKAPASRAINSTTPITGGGDLSADRTFAIAKATAAVDGYLSAADWTTFNAKQPAGSYLTAVTAADTSIAVTGSSAIAVALATNSGLEIVSGLRVKGFKQAVPGSPAAGESWFDTTKKANVGFLATDGTNTAQGSMPILLSSGSSDVTITPNTTLTAIGAPYTYTFPAGFLNVLGRIIRVRFYCTLQQNTAAFFDIRPRLATIPLFAATGTAAASGANDMVFDLDFVTTVTGASGVIKAFAVNNPNIAMASSLIVSGTISPSIDLTAAVTFDWTGQGRAVNTDTLTAHFQRIEVIV